MVNWHKRDLELLNEVTEVVKYLYEQEKPLFVNKSRVGKTVGKLSLIEINLNKLPKTKLFLESHIESREGYQIRLLKWACKEVYKQDREFVRRWRVIGHAGIRDNISERAEKALQKK